MKRIQCSLSLTLHHRRLIMAGLTLSTFLSLGIVFFLVLEDQGFGLFEGLMMLFFLCTLPWLSVNFWNTVIGFLLICCTRDPTKSVRCFTQPARHTSIPFNVRTAIIMPVCNEDSWRVFRNLRFVIHELQATAHARVFDFFLLSDSTNSDIIHQEEQAFSSLKTTANLPEHLYYRRRKQKKRL